MATLEQQIANLRLQLDALEKSTKAASLPEAVVAMRKTVKWSAIVIAVALVVSSLVRLASDQRIDELEKRVQLLEKNHTP